MDASINPPSPAVMSSNASFTSSSTSASFSSSFSSSAASSMLPAAPSNSSQSDINSSDHSHLPPPRPRVGTVALAPRPRSSSLALVMGQNYSRANAPVTTSSQLASKGVAAAVATGSRLKRALGGRRKPSDDPSLSHFFRSGKGKEKERDRLDSYVSDSEQVTPSSSRLTPVGGAKQLTLQLASQVFKKSPKTPISPASSVPPPPPPKPAGMMMVSRKPPPLATSDYIQSDSHRVSIMPISPGMTSALNFMRLGDEQERVAAEEKEKKEKSDKEGAAKERQPEPEKTEVEKVDSKDSWRRSDSTISHHTIRPGAGFGNRTPRPVSMAESLQSTHTIVPVNKRLSALVTDADFGMAEEEDDTFKSFDEDIAPVLNKSSSPASSLRSHNRRSMSLNLGPGSSTKSQTPPPTSVSVTEMRHPSRSEGAPISPSASRETPTLTKAAANGFISPSSAGIQTTGNNIKGRLAAWTATNNNNNSNISPPPMYHNRNSPSLPPPIHPNRPAEAPPPQSQPGFRQAAISISNNFGPAAGLAKRAVERVGRAWGGLGSSHNTSASSSTNTAPSSYSSNGSHLDYGLGRTPSNNSSPGLFPTPLGKNKQRRTPNAPSGSWSIGSSTTSASASDSDAFLTPAGPSLGRRLRGPMRRNNGGAGVAGGIVFGRDLKTCVRDTAVYVGQSSEDGTDRRQQHKRQGSVSPKDLKQKALETRMIPALVVRCTQHLMIWGLQEEGLFRISGRSSHVAKLRTEFDTGADYDMSECTPGDLDPHAVASIFKAYLRELPEPILTRALSPYFDLAMTAESNTNSNEPLPLIHEGAKGPSLPSGPKSGFQALRKPPSLSTLAMPSFTGMRPPSQPLLNALRSLISQLPQENRDLIRTVTELINATARAYKETKMPLSNLLLVFCPSLNMSPPLLRVLCEGEGIWDNIPAPASVPPEISPILDIKRESVVIDIASPSSASETRDEGDEVDDSNSEDGNAKEKVFGIERERVRPTGTRRVPVPTMYMDQDSANILEDDDDDSSLLDADASINPSATAAGSETMSVQDDAVSYVSEGNSISYPASHSGPYAPSPPLSSSAESLATPSTSSAAPSFSHLPMNDADSCNKGQARWPPAIAEPINLPLPPAPHKLSFGGIQFPSDAAGESAPIIPLSPKRSIPSLSLPSFGTSSASLPSSPSSARARRLKKPSLHLLFTKRSASSLVISGPSPIPGGGLSPYLQTSFRPTSAVSDSSAMSTPISAVTAPLYSSCDALPPTLDTSIESSPFRLGLGIDDELEATRANAPAASVSVHPPTPSSTAIGPTPIADFYRSPSGSRLDLTLPESEPQPSHLRTVPTLRSKKSKAGSLSSTTSSNHLGLLDNDDEEEDWTQSVLLAADVDGGWSIQR